MQSCFLIPFLFLSTDHFAGEDGLQGRGEGEGPGQDHCGGPGAGDRDNILTYCI